jgi:hypothetical protein
MYTAIRGHNARKFLPQHISMAKCGDNSGMGQHLITIIIPFPQELSQFRRFCLCFSPKIKLAFVLLYVNFDIGTHPFSPITQEESMRILIPFCSHFALLFWRR